jgi:hypothetical protein
MTALALTPDDRRHTALIDEISTRIEILLVGHDVVVRSAVLATLLARFLADYPPYLRCDLAHGHLELVQGLVELFDLQAADRQAN